MTKMKLSLVLIGLLLLPVMLAGCGGQKQARTSSQVPTSDVPTAVPVVDTPTSIPPTASATSLPPTATPTSLPPTDTPTPVPPTATVANTPTPAPSPCESVEGLCIELSSQRKKLTATEYGTVAAGHVTFVLNSQETVQCIFEVRSIGEGKTWDDVRGHFHLGPPWPVPSQTDHPDWASRVNMVNVEPGGSSVKQVELTAGSYYWLWMRWGPPYEILGAGLLTVEQ